MHKYRFSNALGYTLEEMSVMHNASFSGYFMPATMTPEMTADFWRLNGIDALRSVVMHDEHGVFVGMARMGTRGKRGWCGGFGIVPAFRGTGAGLSLAEQMVQVARETGLTTLQLEVLAQNTRAFKLYERVGFTPSRRLFGYELATSALPAGDAALPTESVVVETLLPLLASPVQPCWGCELAAILTAPTEAIVATSSAGWRASLIVQRGIRTRLWMLQLDGELTDAELAHLLRQAAGSTSSIFVYNEPEDSPLLARYQALGLSEFFSQYEMVMRLYGMS